MDEILQEFKDDFLKNLNAKHCAPELRRQNVIAESTETDIAQAKDAKLARGILYDHLYENCTLDQIVVLSRVLRDVDRGFGRTKEIGQRLHARIQRLDGGGTDRSQLNPPLSQNKANTGM